MSLELCCLPLLWSTSRQGLCEGSDFMKSYHSGVYTHEGRIIGLLLTKNTAPRDVFLFDGEIIISYVEFKTKSSGTDTQQQDRRPTLLRAYDDKKPIAIFISDNYPLFSYALPKPIAYCQLGFYVVTHVWDEKENVTTYRKAMFKFLYTQSQPSMWWRPEHTQYDIQAPKEPMFVCPFCTNYSPILYKVGPICLRQGCPVFWTVREGATLSLNNDFLLYVLATDFDSKDEEFDTGVTTVKPLAYHCSQCGLLTPRYIWNKFICDYCREQCLLNVPWYDVSAKHELYRCTPDSGRATIRLVRPSEMALKEATQILDQYRQESSAGRLILKWTPLRRGIMYTNYFSHNSGQPYEYVGGSGNTTEWKDETRPPKLAKAFITKSLKPILSSVPDFNELLSVVYLPNQNMAVRICLFLLFHSNDETGVQGFIAGLSMGSDALMEFRAKGDVKDCPILLTIKLTHGDILVMDGSDIQTTLLHRVRPDGYRVAATARYIKI
ncbi:hypothetical protein ARMSODRAFT_982901 [Armillaria solidipes]|uniref:Fe2OG dioxygenase domain-containing protein n=1 Tax=Armillaria solidipes TaxID=1076256 RepID=A0A2H3B4T6_9AGAR|nr:hypothetical protein ARMSODRAFT_982901 [Armillaria solidipes]